MNYHKSAAVSFARPSYIVQQARYFLEQRQAEQQAAPLRNWRQLGTATLARQRSSRSTSTSPTRACEHAGAATSEASTGTVQGPAALQVKGHGSDGGAPQGACDEPTATPQSFRALRGIHATSARSRYLQVCPCASLFALRQRGALLQIVLHRRACEDHAAQAVCVSRPLSCRRVL